MIKKTKINLKKGVACLLAALQIGLVAGCNAKNAKDENQVTISKEEYQTLLDNLDQKDIALEELDLELHNLIKQINHLEAQNDDLNELLNDLDYLREKLAKAEAEDFNDYLNENNTATIEGEVDIKGDYWLARRYKTGDNYHCVIDITDALPLDSDSRLKEIIDNFHFGSYNDYPGDLELNISLDNLAVGYLSNIPFEKFNVLNILPCEKAEIDADFTMPSFDGELESIFFDTGTFEKISQENITKLLGYVSKHNGNIVIDRFGTDEKGIIESIAEDIKDMHFDKFVCYWVNNDCLDAFKYIPAETIVPRIIGKYSYQYKPNSTYVLNDATKNLSLDLPELKEGLNVESSHSINLVLSVGEGFYDVNFNLPENSNIDLSCDDYALFTDTTLASLDQYNVTYNDGKPLQSDVNAVKEMNTLSKNIKLDMLENKDYRRFKITLTIPKEGISEEDYLDLENIISFCNTYGDIVFNDLTVNAYNEQDLNVEMIKHLYFYELRNVTFNNYGGNISFLNIFNSSNGCGYTKLTFNNYSKVNDYDLLNKVVSNYTADAGEAILNSVDSSKLYITYRDGIKDSATLLSDVQVQKLMSYGYSEEEAWEIVNNEEYDKIFYFTVYINGEKNTISYEKTYSLTKTK